LALTGTWAFGTRLAFGNPHVSLYRSRGRRKPANRTICAISGKEESPGVTELNPTSIALVSVHGGHSREFGDADDSSLEEIICAYVSKGFKWVGITEHIPPVSADFLFPWEIEEGQTFESRMKRFAEYFSVARKLQRAYRDSIQILVGFETESYTGYVAHVNNLRNRFQPDYIVGSVHHLKDICIDGPPEWYA
jgi:histidinol-phosphatase (PHP family)